MKQIIDQLILLIYCTASLLMTTADIAFVAAFLSAIIYTSIYYFNNSKRYGLLSTAIYIILSFFFPGLLLFFPIIIYNIMKHKIYLLLPVPAVYALWYFSGISYGLCIFLMLGSVIAVFFQYYTHSYEDLVEKYKNIN